MSWSRINLFSCDCLHSPSIGHIYSPSTVNQLCNLLNRLLRSDSEHDLIYLFKENTRRRCILSRLQLVHINIKRTRLKLKSAISFNNGKSSKWRLGRIRMKIGSDWLLYFLCIAFDLSRRTNGRPNGSPCVALHG